MANSNNNVGFNPKLNTSRTDLTSEKITDSQNKPGKNNKNLNKNQVKNKKV